MRLGVPPTIHVLEILSGNVVDFVVCASLAAARTPHVALIFIDHLLLGRWSTLSHLLLSWLLDMRHLPVLGAHTLIVVVSSSHRWLLLLRYRIVGAWLASS